LEAQDFRSLAGRLATRNFSREEWLEHLEPEPYRPTFPGLP
jgi:hypothetical protein